MLSRALLVILTVSTLAFGCGSVVVEDAPGQVFDAGAGDGLDAGDAGADADACPFPTCPPGYVLFDDGVACHPCELDVAQKCCVSVK